MTSSIQLDWKAATWSGIIAGVVFLALEMVMVPVFGGGSPWGPPRMMAAMGLHFVLSIVYAVIFALAVSRLSLGPALGLGGVGGLILYLVNFYGFTALFPWFAMARNWISIFGHLVFGLVAAGAYVGIRKHHLHLREEAHGGAPLRERKV